MSIPATTYEGRCVEGPWLGKMLTAYDSCKPVFSKRRRRRCKTFHPKRIGHYEYVPFAQIWVWHPINDRVINVQKS